MTTWRDLWRGRRLAAPVAAALLLALALLLPDVRLARPVAHVVVVLDVSQSMNTRDCRLDRAAAAVSRLACVKDALADALRELPCGAQLAWGVFSGYQTFVLGVPVEVCTHRGELLETLAGLDWRVAWEQGSRIGHGLASVLRVIPTVPHEADLAPGFVFVTDGHEAPTLAVRNRRRLGDFAGKAFGVLVGVGSDDLTPIPKYDMDGRYLGEWQADDVPQADVSSVRALSSVPGERMVGDEADDVPASGTEHLSSLKEDYLRLLASDARLDYRRLARRSDMLAALQSPGLRRPLPIDTDLRWIPAAVALVLLLLS